MTKNTSRSQLQDCAIKEASFKRDEGSGFLVENQIDLIQETQSLTTLEDINYLKCFP